MHNKQQKLFHNYILEIYSLRQNISV